VISLKTKLELEGLRRLGPAFSAEVEERALKDVAKPVAASIAARIDAEHHATGLTAEDITVAVSKAGRAQGEAVVLIGARGGKRGRAFLLSFLEFGTFKQPATPVVRPTFREYRDSFLPAVTERLAVHFQNAVKRHTKGRP
jgi:HK97 gp10 family phage protein